ncbi:NAD(P)-linked oxidoreductase superfamily protein [Striga asiatica]|uniref:NAD(P)-linked oxidoreductase superfamily protein n=1 Tax=Striga asiatica TaxID=4170 RepID=A0A5A7PAI4_STRAF|nr:NAD(P)-linked oxidoreductase superfamily protein [Striga asiatica]
MNLPLGENLANDTAGTLSSIIVFSNVPVAVSQILHDPSWLPDTISEPSRLKCTEVTGIAWARITWTAFPVLTSQTLTVSSKDPETIRFDCGLKFTQKTMSVWPLSVFTHSAARASQIRIVESEDQARSETPSAWPIRREIWERVSVEYTIRVLSREAEAKSAPLLENFTLDTARVWPVRIFLRR